MSLTPQASTYLPGYDFKQYLETIGTMHPFVVDLIDQERGLHGDGYSEMLNKISWEFESGDKSGRGEAYNRAQMSADNHGIGIIALMGCFSANNQIPDESFVILDALAGDGTVSRYLRSTEGPCPTLISADMSGFMVEACLRQGFPCIRQSATQSLLKDEVLDGVLIAFGSHHIDNRGRQVACAEAFRTLKPRGRLVLQDYEIGGTMEKWFKNVVDPFSSTGHDHPHFSREEMFSLLVRAGFRDVRVFDMGTPLTWSGQTASEAVLNAVSNMYYTFDLTKISNDPSQIISRTETYIRNTLGDIAVHEAGGGYVAMIESPALVAVGVKV